MAANSPRYTDNHGKVWTLTPEPPPDPRMTFTFDKQQIAQAAELSESRDSYGRELRAAVRGLWTGALSAGDFTDTMQGAISRGLTQAWHEGAAVMGVGADELSQKELDALSDEISGQYEYIDGFADAITDGSKANGGAIAPLLSRAELWQNKYDEVLARAMVLAGGDAKLEWTVHADESCLSCLSLSGKVKRASEWEASGLRPLCMDLQCMKSSKGVPVCKCKFVRTDKRISRGALPAL